jgi:hypothetical protein
MVVVDIDRTGQKPVREETGAGPCPDRRHRPAPGPFPPARRAARWQPLVGDELLQRLRVTGRRRPLVDPELAHRLRAALDHGLGDDDAVGGGVPTASSGAGAPVGSPGGPVLVVTKDRLAGALACAAHTEPQAGFGERTPTTGLACGALVDVLFRQLVTVGTLGDPMADGLAALTVDERQRSLVDWIERMPPTERNELEAEVVRQARGLERRWPALDPSWLPRTQEVLRARVAHGTVELSARVDLAVGRPAVDESSVALIEVKSGSRSRLHRTDLHFYALVETLKTSAPPFAVATYYTRTGELDVEPVTEDLLAAAARRTVLGTRAIKAVERGVDTPPPGGLCGRCSTLPGWGLGHEPARTGPRRPDPDHDGGGQA